MRTRTAAIIVFLVAAALYVPSVRNGFAYDDHVIVSLNERVHDLGRAHLIFAESYWADEDLGLYRPLTSLSYAVDWAIGGGSPAWFHGMNVLWNAVACVLVFALLAVFVPVWPALVGALIFAVHPVHVEAVANVVGRAEIMAAVFSLAALLLWARTEAGPQLSVRRLTAVAACYAFALLSKESAVMLPALLALIDIALRRLRPDNILQWLRLHARSLAVLALVAVAFVLARTAVLGEIGPGRVDPALDVATSTSARIRTALQAWPHIVRLLFYPRTLLSDYGPRIIMPALSMTPAALLGGIIFGILVGGGLSAWLRGRAQLALVALFIPVALLPVSNLLLPIGVIVAERALYLPSFAFAAALAFGAAHVWTRARAPLWIGIATTLVLAAFAARALVRIPEWRSTDAVFAALRRDRPDAFRAKWHHARVAVGEKNAPLALQRYADAINTWPFREHVIAEAAAYAAHQRDIPFALKLADYGLTRWPRNLDLLRLRAGIALDLADTTTARAIVEQGLGFAPRDSILLRMRAVTHTADSP